MPYLPNPVPILVVKLVGYTVAGAVLRKTYNRGPNALLFSIARVACGLALGIITLPFVVAFGEAGGNLILFLWLFATRLVVWGLLVFLMFERGSLSRKRYGLVVLIGIAWSFLLDGTLYLLQRTYPDMMSIPWC